MFRFTNVLAIIFIVLVLSEMLSFFMPYSSPFGMLGGASYLNSAIEGKTSTDFEASAKQIAENMTITFVCDSGRRGFEAQGGMAGLQERTFRDIMNGYKRSQIVWPIFYALSLVALVGSAINSTWQR